MDDMNKNQEHLGQNPNQMSGQQSPDQYQNQYQGHNFDPITGQPLNQNQNPEAGKTYWESQNGNQYANQTYTGQQGFSGQEPSAQFYQNYQQPMGGPSYQTPQPQMQAPKKPKKKLAAALIALVLVLALAGTAFAFKDKIISVFSGSKNPAEYYASLEQDALNASIDKMMKSYGSFDPSKPMAFKVSANLTYDKATLSSILSGYAGMTIEDLESMLGLPLDSIGADMTIALDGSKFYDAILLKLNKADVITLELLIDTIQQELLMRFPELSSAYIRQSLDSALVSGNASLNVIGNDFDLFKDISPEDMADFTKRYVKVITESMSDVELTKGEELKIGGTTQKCTLLTVTIDEDILKDILMAVIKEAKNDKLILKLLPSLQMSKNEYVAALEEAEKELEDGLAGSMDGKVVMQVYVDNDDKIVGRTIEVFSGKTSQGVLSYGIATKGKDSEYEFYVEDALGTRYVELTGSHTKNKDAYTGEADIEINGNKLGMDSISFNIEYEDFRTETKGDQTYTYGKVTVSSLLLMGMEFSLEYDVVDGVQHTKLSVGMGGTSIVGLDVAAEPLKNFTIPEVDRSAQIFDSYDTSGYEETVDIEKFINDLSGRLGVDLNTIIENFMYYGF
jgi:hypothetical protein